MFRSLTLFRLPLSGAKALNDIDLETVLSEKKLRPCGPMELSTSGFVSPFGRGEGKAMTHAVGHFTLINVGHESKLLPAAVINDEVRARCDKILEEEQRKVGGKERKRMKEDVINDLLPRAFIRQGRQPLYIDRKGGWVVIDSTSRKAAEGAVSQVREALGTFPAVPMTPEEDPRTLLTHWLKTGELPEGLVMGEECEMKAPGDASGPTIKAKNQDLQCDEIRDHLSAGKQVTQLALVWDNRLSFVLAEDLSVRKFKYLDVVLDEAAANNTETKEAEIDASFTLLTLEAEKLIEKMVECSRFHPWLTDPMDLAATDVVVFDAFGTLVRRVNQGIDPLRRLFAHRDPAIPADALGQALRQPHLFREWGQQWGVASEVIRALAMDLSVDLMAILPFPESVAALRAVRQSGRQVVICSNLAADYAAPLKRQFQSLVNHWVMSYQVGAVKPDPSHV